MLTFSLIFYRNASVNESEKRLRMVGLLLAEDAKILVNVTENATATATETVNVKTTTTGRRDADARMTSLRMSAARESEAMTDQILYYQNRQHLLACLLPLYP